jgi:DNA processing protein
VVVEAGGRSGALITVDHALDLGRDVWAVPGPIDCETCVGSNRLLAEGARPLVALRDFVAAVVPGDDAERASGETHAPRAPIGSEADAPRAGGPAGPSLESGVLHALRESGSLVDEVARQVGLPVETTLALLTTLELHGEVERLPGMRFRRAA